MSITAIGKAILGPVLGFLSERSTRKHIQRIQARELEDVRHQRKMHNVSEGRMAEVDWNTNAQDTAGLRDEWITLLLSIPMVMSFIPGLSPYVTEGFAALSTTPVWYQGGIGVMIGSAFGYQKYAQWSLARHQKKVETDDNNST